MNDIIETCPECHRTTDKGKEQHRDYAKEHPIFYKDKFKPPLSDLIKKLRSDLSNIRGKLSDIRSAYGREEDIEFIEGGLTCIIVALYGTEKEFIKSEEKSRQKERE